MSALDTLLRVRKESVHTPWGQSDYSKELADGIVFHGTPSHGGIHLSRQRQSHLLQIRINRHPTRTQSHPTR